jgi:hypothetical protein
MRRWILVLSVTLGLQILAAAGLALRHSALAPAQSDTPLVAAKLDAADRLVIEGPRLRDESSAQGKAARIEIARRDGKWLLPGYFDAPADGKKVSDLIRRLTDARRGPPIATTPEALGRFKVADDEYERRVVASQGDKKLATVFVGSAPGLRKADARTADDKAVYPVNLATFDMPTDGAQWLDRALLAGDAANLAEIVVTQSGREPVTLRHPNADRHGGQADDAPAPAAKATPDKSGETPPAAPAWRGADLPAGRHLDATQAAALAHAITGMHVDGVLGTQAKPEWQQDAPQLRLTLKDTAGRAVTWTISQMQGGDDRVLKSSNAPWYLQVKSWNARPLLDAADRDKLIVADAAAPAPAAKTAHSEAQSAAHTKR